MSDTFIIIGLIRGTTLIFINNTRYKIFGYRVFETEGIGKPCLTFVLCIMYGNCKGHKQQVDGCPPFRPILSALQTPTYNLAKFLVPILNPLTKDEYAVKDSFQFAEEICEQDPTLTVGSLDVDLLFTNIPLDETIVIV